MYEAKLGVISNSLYQPGGRDGGGGRVGFPKIKKNKIAQNDVKHILVLEFLRSDDFLGVHEKISFVKNISTGQHTYRRHSE